MTFYYQKRKVLTPVPPHEAEVYHWWAVQGPKGKQETVLVGPRVRDTEKEIRSDIAAARTAMQGAKFAKVEEVS